MLFILLSKCILVIFYLVCVSFITTDNVHVCIIYCQEALM